MEIVAASRKRRRASPRKGDPSQAQEDVDLDMDLEVDAVSDGDDDEPSAKRAMRIRTQVRLLEKLPGLRDYQRDRHGRRGAVDGGMLTGAAMMAALEGVMQETSLRRAAPDMVAPVTIAPTSARRNAGLSEVHNVRNLVDGHQSARHAAYATKDDEARPAST